MNEKELQHRKNSGRKRDPALIDTTIGDGSGGARHYLFSIPRTKGGCLLPCLGDKMKGPVDEVKVDLPCRCGKTVQKSVGWVKSHIHETFTCPCGRVIHLDDSDVRRKLAEADRLRTKAGRK